MNRTGSPCHGYSWAFRSGGPGVRGAEGIVNRLLSIQSARIPGNRRLFA